VHELDFEHEAANVTEVARNLRVAGLEAVAPTLTLTLTLTLALALIRAEVEVDRDHAVTAAAVAPHSEEAPQHRLAVELGLGRHQG